MSQFFTTEKAQYYDLDFITVKSNALKNRADITVYNPVKTQQIPNLPLVILLHGVYGSHWAWALKGHVHKTLDTLIAQNKTKPMLLAMPSDGLYGDGSAYLPHHTANYETYITQDIIATIKEQYPSVSQHSKVFITGLSMGGYGALRIGAKYGNIFSAFSGLSSITDISQMQSFVTDYPTLLHDVTNTESVLETIIKNKTNHSPFRFDCGTSDPLITHNQTLHNELKSHNIEHIYKEHQGGHTWDYWQTHIVETLLFFNQYV